MNSMRITAFLLCLFAGCLAAGGASAANLATVRSTGVLRVGTTGDYKPFSFREPNGSYQGADITMARSLAAALGVRIVFVPTEWGELSSDFAANKFDIAVGGITILPEREKIADFSTPVLVDGKRPIVRCADRMRFSSISAIDQANVRVVVNSGGSNEAFAGAHFQRAKLTVFPNNVTIFNEIIAGREDVMVTDGTEVNHQALMHPALCAADVPAPSHVWRRPTCYHVTRLSSPWSMHGGRSSRAAALGNVRLMRPSTNPEGMFRTAGLRVKGRA